MKGVDYSEILTESSTDHKWKTAHDVDPSDFPRVTRRLRYQASQLGLEISITTDKQNRTVSFLSWESDTCPAHGRDCPYIKRLGRCPIRVREANTIVTIAAIGAIFWTMCTASIAYAGFTNSENYLQVAKEGHHERRAIEDTSPAERLRRMVLRGARYYPLGRTRRGRRATDSGLPTRFQVTQDSDRMHLDVPHRALVRGNS